MVKIIEIIKENEENKILNLKNNILNNKLVICAIFMPGCHWCEMLSKEWKKLPKHFENNDLIISYIHMNVVPKMANNNIKFSKNTINGYPHVMLFDKSPNNIVEYNGSREEDALVNWIKNSIKKNMSLKGGRRTSKTRKSYSTSLISTSSTKDSLEKNRTRRVRDKYKDTKLYPKIIPYKKSKLKVSDEHSIAYYLFGNSKGKPVLFIHGGPGAGTSNNDARFFDPSKYFIILFDQRGCGNSKPFGSLKHNTTNHLIEDIEKLRKHLSVKKWMLFGGSWGSTLALAYAINYPQNVKHMVLRGIFLIRKHEVDWVNSGKGAHRIFPEAWEIYKSNLTEKEEKNYIKSYGEMFDGKKGKRKMDKALMNWSLWESSISKLVPDSKESIEKDLKKTNMYKSMSKIEHHYFTNKGFFPRDGFLLEKKNIDKIKNIPTIIVQGRYDIVCPASSAYSLHKRLPKSKLYITIAGHSSFEPETIKKLVQATNYFKNK